MKHCIIAKFTADAYERRQELLVRIGEIFADAVTIPACTVWRCCPTAWRGATGMT